MIPNKTEYLQNEVCGCLIKVSCPDISESYFANYHFVGIIKIGGEDVLPPLMYF